MLIVQSKDNHVRCVGSVARSIRNGSELFYNQVNRRLPFQRRISIDAGPPQPSNPLIDHDSMLENSQRIRWTLPALKPVIIGAGVLLAK